MKGKVQAVGEAVGGMGILGAVFVGIQNLPDDNEYKVLGYLVVAALAVVYGVAMRLLPSPKE